MKLFLCVGGYAVVHNVIRPYRVSHFIVTSMYVSDADTTHSINKSKFFERQIR